MFFIGVPKTENIRTGSIVKINGFSTMLLRIGDTLQYNDSDGILNICKILSVRETDDLTMPDGSKASGTYYMCASHEQDPNECVVIEGGAI